MKRMDQRGPASAKLILGLCTTLALTTATAQVDRSYDGYGNNVDSVQWGQAGTPFRNYASNGFGDAISTPGGTDRPNPRAISNAIGSQSSFIANELGTSDLVWGWGQFVDHDINLNDDQPLEPIAIDVPACDPQFDPNCTGSATIPMFRSFSDPLSGTGTANPRRNINAISGFLDGSTVYGSDPVRAAWLRTFSNGKLKMSAGGLLPWNTVDGEYASAVDPDAPFMLTDGPVPPVKHFVAGDVRANEQPGLASMQTLWVREHNRLCDEISAAHPTWTDEAIYQRARKTVGALIQVITYQEFLPAIGLVLPPYGGYDPQTDPRIMNCFSAAAYRFGHTLVNGELMRYDEDGNLWSFGTVDLRNAFFAPTILKDEGGIEPFLRGMAAQEHQRVDPLIMDDLRNMLFGQPGSGGLDLLSINIQRGRERGVPDFNTLRTDFQLPACVSMTELTADTLLRYKLTTAYGGVGDIDPWIGLMSEDHLPGALFGQTLSTILGRQFQALRDGDRYFYAADPAFTPSEVDALNNTTLADVILRNTSIQTLQPNVFMAVPRDALAVELLPFSDLHDFALRAFPNPAQQHFELAFEAHRAGAASLEFFDQQGRLVRTDALTIAAGSNQFRFDLGADLAAGLYSIVLRTQEGRGQLRLVKQ
ncbi:MAG: T9SS type A sorting domain-containing protein [Flavobacteriales bacterium]|nr:T9SS type A sorting domain-containing protein [Flavobacteriales bacterium]